MSTGLFLRHLTLGRFRSHAARRLSLDGRPVALFGANGAGKTNVLEAISLLSPGRGLRRARPEELPRRPETQGWKVSAEVHALGQVHEIETWAEPGASRQVRIDGKSAPQIALGRVLRVVWLVPAMDRLWTEGAEGRRRFLDRATLSFIPAHADVVLTYEKAMRERNRLLREGIADPHWHDALEAQMARAGAEIHANRLATLARLSEAQSGSESAFPTAQLSLVSAEGHDAPKDAEALARALSAGRQRDLSAGRTLIGPHRADLEAIYAAKNMPARDCSTGEQKALLVSLVLANARALAADLGAPPILLLDEVAAHLDARRRADLYDEICALRAQAFMTGTGAELFAALGERAQWIEVAETAQGSTLHESGPPGA